MKTEYLSHSTNETERIGEETGKTLRKGSIVALFGNLGVGKTVFARGLLKGLGYIGIVSSPTYTIANEYILKDSKVVHFDMYRIDDEESLETAGFYDCLEDDSIVIIEWSERIENILPKDIKRVYITGNGEDERSITIIQGETDEYICS